MFVGARKPQLDKIFGLSHLTDRGGVSAGVDALCDMESDENFVTCLPSETTSMIVPELIPGREYHVMIRAVSHAGAGKWSPVLTPLLTPPIAPRIATALIVEYVTKTECKLIFELPYDNGAPITEAVVKIHRAEGPLAHHDIDPDTGSVHDHHSLKTYPFDPFSCVVVDMFGAKGNTFMNLVRVSSSFCRSLCLFFCGSPFSVTLSLPILHVQFTDAVCTPVFSTCHKLTSASALLKLCPKTKVHLTW